MGLEIVSRAAHTENISVDLHCVTRWSKLDTHWEGLSLDTILAEIETDAEYAMVRSYSDYTTNLSLDDLRNKQAWIAFRLHNEDLATEHGGPARLLVPHLYLWKSAKWVRGVTLLNDDQPGFWESLGYHNYGTLGASSATRTVNDVACRNGYCSSRRDGDSKDNRSPGPGIGWATSQASTLTFV